MADATPLSFTKTIDIRDAEGTITTNATTTVDGLLSTDNTAVFTPTGDYNPATKKYVDDGYIAGDGSITDIVEMTASDYGNIQNPPGTTLYIIID